MITDKTRLTKHFKQFTTFNVRWKKGLLHDFIAPGVYRDEFLSEFSRKELKRLVADGLVKETYYSDPQGSKRAVVIFIDYKMPQVEPFKQGMESLAEIGVTAWLRIFVLIACAIALLVSLPWHKAFGFASSEPRPLRAAMPLGNSSNGYFDDEAQNIRCYWLKTSTDGIALSCLEKTK